MKNPKTFKLYPNELPKHEKHNFYRQEIFEDQSSFKLYLLFIAFILIAIDKIGDFFIFPRVTDDKSNNITDHLFYLCGAIITYIVSFVIHRKKNDTRAFNVRLFLNLIATCLLAAYLVLENVESILHAIDAGTVVSWDQSLEDYSSSICITILASLLMPPWYLRIIVPCGYYFAMIYAYFIAGHVLKYWVLLRLGVNTIIIVLLTLLQTKSRWRLFTKTLEAEGWNQVYQDILSRIPSALGVLSLDGDILYSNEGLKGLLAQRGQDQKVLYQDIVYLKKRQAIMRNLSYIKTKSQRNIQQESIASESYKINIYKEDLLSPAHIPGSRLVPFEQLIAESNQFNEEDIKDSFLDDKHGGGSRFEALREFNNFEELLRVFKAHFESSDDLIDEAHLTYDGKVLAKSFIDENDRPIEVSYEVRIFPLYEYKKVILMLNNTTQRDLIASAEENNQYKDRLLASLSHNLRTPLNGNLTFLQGAMTDPRVSCAAKEELIMPAIRSGTLLLNLINDILDYSLIQSQEFSVSLQYKSLQKTLENAFDLFKNNIAAKDLDYKLEIDSRINDKFETDHQRVTQIILNLIANAIKFTYKGGITLKATYVKAGKVDISVSDTGIGMNEKEIEDLKRELDNPSAVLTSSRKMKGKSKGLGLGLRVSDDLAKRLGESSGGIRFESVQEQGSCFSFAIKSNRVAELECHSFALFTEKSHQFDPPSTIPAIQGGNVIFSKPTSLLSQTEIETLSEIDKKYNKFPEVYSPLKKSSKSILSPKKHKFETLSSAKPRMSQLTNLTSMTQEILIVDDDPMNILGLGLLLNKLNFSTDKAYNGQQAIEKIQEKCKISPLNEGFQYRAIFMDCQMPIMDGYQASKALRKLMRLKKIPHMPIIGCTAFTTKNKLDECIASGMDSVITKPVSLEMLTQILMHE